MEVITKRLHVSGLTPSITPADLSSRLSAFGITVKQLDGFGKLDGVGQPRKFGYVTIEATKPQLAKCLNVLSGSTWKGTKLRIGDAKADFSERFAKESADAAEPPRKKRRRAVGTHAPDMSLVTPENAATRPGWRVTPLGRIVRPVRMRPERPLLPSVAKVQKKTAPERKRKRKEKAPLTRARRRTIDPTKWESTHLKGMFLDVEMGPRGSAREEIHMRQEVDQESESEEDSDEGAGDVAGEEVVRDEHTQEPVIEVVAPTMTDVTVPDGLDITQEKNQTLNLLRNLFGDEDDAWIGRESVGSDIDHLELRTVGEVEDVPMDVTDQGEEAPESEPEPPVPAPAPGSQQATQQDQSRTKLKDLFAPREEEVGFSLLGHLDLDLELDDEQLVDPPLPVGPSAYTSASAPPPAPAPQLAFDPKQPLFFPARGTSKGKARDLFDVAKEKGWGWREAGFYRTETEGDIRKRWEESKVELTREWKKRHREAGKLRRRRRGGDGD